MDTKPHVERLARLLHNRIVRRVRHAAPTADCLLLVGDLADGCIALHPTGVWDRTGAVLDLGGGEGWRLLVDDLRPEFALLARVQPVALFEPYVLDLRQLDLRIED